MRPTQPGTEAEKPANSNSIEAARAVHAGHQTLDKLTNAATVQKVYGQAVIHGANVVIPAAEILSVAGFGMGAGGQHQAGPGPDGSHGSGGGGWVISRPVGVIIISERGVRVKPFLDITKIVLTAIPVIGLLITILLRNTRAGRARELSARERNPCRALE